MTIIVDFTNEQQKTIKRLCAEIAHKLMTECSNPMMAFSVVAMLAKCVNAHMDEPFADEKLAASMATTIVAMDSIEIPG
jgi:hypothetical protein